MSSDRKDSEQDLSQYVSAVKEIKNAILDSRYRVARQANKEVLQLNYGIGRFISVNSRSAKWGSNAITVISKMLQQELPGLKGFSEASIKMMRIFYEEWCHIFENRQLAIDDLGNPIIDSISSDNIRIEEFDTDKLSESDLSYFLNVGFTNHYIIISRTTTLEERLYYIRRCATEFWKVETTKYYLKEDLYHKEGSIQQTNFARTAGTFQKGFAKHRGFEEVVVTLQKRFFTKIYDDMGKHLQNFNEIENNLAIKIERIIRESRQAAYRAVNFTMVIAYWNIGKVIVEDELHWERAEYGKSILKNISKRLTKEFGKGFDESNLRYMRLFYKTFPICDALRHELSWTHYRRDSYIRMFDALTKQDDDNPTIGLILCSEKNEAIAKYSVLNDAKQIFASKYKLTLPTEEELQIELNKARKRFESES